MLDALSAAGADYLVVGAHALAAHGRPRATGDLDLWVRPTPENARRVWRALEAFGAPLGDVTLEDLSRPDVVFQIGVVPRRIDLLTSITEVSFDEAWENRSRRSAGPGIWRTSRTSAKPTDTYQEVQMIEIRSSTIVAVALVVALAACGDTREESGPVAERVEIEATSYAYSPSTITVPAGRIRFVIHNGADIVHGFEVEGHGMEEEIEEIQPGATDSLTVTFDEPGTYEIYCPVDDHEQRGMTGSLEVTAAP